MRHKHARRTRKPAELLLVPMIDIFTVLVTFLLMTAVFSRITIVELDLPSAASAQVVEPVFRLEVVLRESGFEVTNGTVEYDDLIQVMDAIRSTKVSPVTDLQPTTVALFKDIAVGDAP
jgi:biopolymer transport protein ExbD